ncbi:MAG: isopentenyl phosphate kinase [Anaerolineae bacterium]
MKAEAAPGPLFFVKLGGSLITDKQRRSTARRGIIKQLATELAEARAQASQLRLVLGHGSGSFGHWEASHYGTHEGIYSAEAWQGFTRVSAAALQLDRLVLNAFIAAGVPVLSLQPLASALADAGALVSLELGPIRRALAHGLVPLIFGDVAFDQKLGGTIVSTEELFAHLATYLHPTWILLLGNAPGVLDGEHQVIPTITPETLPEVKEHLRSSAYTDVTGGMADKVEGMVELVEKLPEVRVRIMTGLTPGNLREALLDPEGISTGTLIHS